MAIEPSQLELILKRAKEAGTFNFVSNVLDLERDQRRRRIEELDTVIAATRQAIAQSNTDLEVIQKNVLAKLKTDKELVDVLNTSLQPYRNVYKGNYQYADNECTIPLKSNKMNIAIPGAEGFIQSHFYEVFTGTNVKMPAGYTYHVEPSTVVAVGSNDTTIYGNSKSTYLETAALTTLLTATGKDRLQDARFGTFQDSNWIDRSVMAHLTRLPNNIHLSTLDSRFEKFTYAFGDLNQNPDFAFIHSGYAYGGQRSEGDWYPQGKIGGPEDCSSWLRNITESSCAYTTADQLFFYRSKLEPASVVSADWLKSAPELPALDAILTPVAIRDPQTDIKPGMVFAHRDFDLAADPLMTQGLGKSGHTGVVLDFAEAKIIGFGANRNMPNVEGIGSEHFPYGIPGRKTMLFSVSGNAVSRAAGSTSLWQGNDFLGDKAVYRRVR